MAHGAHITSLHGGLTAATRKNSVVALNQGRAGRDFFRGAFAVGDLYRLSERENTITRAAVSDAATWYALSNWIGINGTPHATIYLDSLLTQSSNALAHLLVEYPIPLKDGARPSPFGVDTPEELRRARGPITGARALRRATRGSRSARGQQRPSR